MCGRTGTSAKVSVIPPNTCHSLPPHTFPALIVKMIIICRRPRIDRSQIGQPMNFRHTGHVGSTDLGWEFGADISPSSQHWGVRNQRCNIWYLIWNVCIQCRVSLFFNNLSPSCQPVITKEAIRQISWVKLQAGTGGVVWCYQAKFPLDKLLESKAEEQPESTL